MLAQFARWFQPSHTLLESHDLYIALVRQSRQPFFYSDYAVADSLDGRFDMIVLHLFLYTQALTQSADPALHETANELVDIMMNDMDRSLREIGVGDMSVGKKVKKMAHALNGRFTIYTDALQDEASLHDALTRNVYRGAPTDPSHVQKLATYVQAAVAALARTDEVALKTGAVSWPTS